jgi:hypothetical protein
MKKLSHRHLLLLCTSFLGMTAVAHADINRAGLITLTDQGNGTLRSEVMLPCGQSQVWAIVRKNGVQVTQQNVVTSFKPIGNEYFCTYNLSFGGFANGDVADVRFNSTLGSGVTFTPGPDAQAVVSTTIGRNPVGTRPGHLNIVDLGSGSARYELTAPSGEQYAEVFARQNGAQNVAGGITATEKPVCNGYSRYTRNASGYRVGDFLEYRAYQYLPASPGVFTPGPSESQWLNYYYGSSPGEFFRASDTTYNLAPLAGGDIDVYFAHNTSNVTPQSTGWMLVRGMLPMLTVPAPRTTATLLQAYIRQCSNGVWVPLSSAPAFNVSGASQEVSSNLYQYTPATANNQLPGQQVDPTYECGGYPVTINTRTGPVTLITGAKVQYAYVVRHY